MDNFWILAQAQPSEPSSVVSAEPVTSQTEGTLVASEPNAPITEATRPGPIWTQYIFIAVIFVMMYLLLFRGPRKKQQQHRQMVQSLEKNDKVRTIGGIIGTVVDIKGDEITLKVDESNNTKIKVTAAAIGKNLSKDKP